MNHNENVFLLTSRRYTLKCLHLDLGVTPGGDVGDEAERGGVCHLRHGPAHEGGAGQWAWLARSGGVVRPGALSAPGGQRRHADHHLLLHNYRRHITSCQLHLDTTSAMNGSLAKKQNNKYQKHVELCVNFLC